MKKHLETSELVLLCLNIADISSNHENITAHIDDCPQCQKQLHAVEKQLDKIHRESLAECESCQQYLKNEQEISLLPDNHKKHLEECALCTFIYEFRPQMPTLEDMAHQPQPLSEHQLAKIDQKIKRELRNENLKTFIDEKKQNAVDAVRNGIMELTLVLRPLPEPSAIRGKVLDHKIIFTHRGGHLKLHTGQPNAKVKLSAIFQDKTFENFSDKSGDVTFINLVDDDYTIDIDGHEVKSINDMF